MKALLVEDDLNYADMVRRFCPAVVFVHANTLARAEELLRGQEWDVVWLDRKLPDGPETPELLVAFVRAYSKDAAVILASAYIEKNNGDYGADACAHKDDLVLPEQMQDLIEAAVAHRKKKPPFERAVESVTALVKTRVAP